MSGTIGNTRKLVTSAMLIAVGTVISFVCEFIPFLNLPFGGTITIASTLPVVLISYMYGLSWGFGSAFVFALMQMVVGMKTVSALFTPSSDSFMGIGIAIAVIMLDYILAFTSLGLGGIFRNLKSRTGALVLGAVVAGLACYFFHFVSGALFYGAWAEWFFTDTVLKDLPVSKWIMENLTGGGLAAVYSAVYNGCYMIPEIVITAVIAVPVCRIPPVRKY